MSINPKRAVERCVCLEQGELRGQCCPIHDLGQRGIVVQEVPAQDRIELFCPECETRCWWERTSDTDAAVGLFRHDCSTGSTLVLELERIPEAANA